MCLEQGEKKTEKVKCAKVPFFTLWRPLSFCVFGVLWTFQYFFFLLFSLCPFFSFLFIKFSSFSFFLFASFSPFFFPFFLHFSFLSPSSFSLSSNSFSSLTLIFFSCPFSFSSCFSVHASFDHEKKGSALHFVTNRDALLRLLAFQSLQCRF